MCGIIGYVGKGDALPKLITGLERLEYRGYDSAGIAIIDPAGGLQVSKVEGRIGLLKDKTSKQELKGTIGMGHTRWATHGVPSETNAHPHSDCTGKIIIAHNGIIENYMQLKQELEGQGHKFISETDSEVVAHLIEEELKNEGDLEKACQYAFKKLRGSFAISVLSSLCPGKMIGVRHNSPLVVGLGDDENFIASDVPAFVGYSKKVIYLENSEMVILEGSDVRIMNMDGEERHHEIHEIDWDIATVEKGGYEKFMMKEIHEQPEAVKKTMMGRINKKQGTVFFEGSKIQPDKLKKMQKLSIVACGTAYHAGIVGRYLIEHFTELPVEIDIASEFRYRRPKLDEFTYVLSVSQSGETADTLASIREAKKKGCYHLSICNVLGSSLARESDAVIYTYAGPEIGVASTKAYTAQLTAFCLLTIYLGQIMGQMKNEVAKKMIKELETIPDKISRVIEKKEQIKKIAEKYAQAKSVFYLGRGFNFPTAMEGALKHKEISYIHAEGYAAGEMKHGPISLIDSDLPIIGVCTKGNSYEKMIGNMKEVEARKGRIIAVATEGDREVADIAEDIIYVPETWEEFSPIINVVPFQLLAYYTALARGCDIDKPKNLAKSVTVE